jgi:hypothetical protein
MDVRGCVEANARGYFDALKEWPGRGAEAAACLREELAAAGPQLTAARAGRAGSG